MYKAIKHELKVNKSESNMLDRTFGCCRFIYNRWLDKKTTAYLADKTSISCFDLMKEVTQLKKQEDFLRLADVSSTALQASLSNLDSAYKNFFRAKKWFPKFKKRGHKQSFKITQNIKVDYDNHTIFIPKIWYVKFYRDKQIHWVPRNATVSKTPAWRYFVSIMFEVEDVQRTWVWAVWVDFWIKTFAVTSDGQVFENQKYLRSNLAKLRIEQRCLARKYKRWVAIKDQSKWYFKQRLVVAKLHEKISFQRKDFLHKFSTELANKYKTVCVENLNVSGMVKNHCLALSISDYWWSMAREMLTYKVKDLRVIGRFEPSSQICNVCWDRNRELKLSQRTWTCNNGHVLDRDHNAAINIKNIGERASPLDAKVSH